MILVNITDDCILRLLAKTARTAYDTVLNRGWYVCDKTGWIHAHKDGSWKVGVDGLNGFWASKIDARSFIKKMKKEHI